MVVSPNLVAALKQSPRQILKILQDIHESIIQTLKRYKQIKLRLATIRGLRTQQLVEHVCNSRSLLDLALHRGFERERFPPKYCMFLRRWVYTTIFCTFPVKIDEQVDVARAELAIRFHSQISRGDCF